MKRAFQMVPRRKVMRRVLGFETGGSGRSQAPSASPAARRATAEATGTSQRRRFAAAEDADAPPDEIVEMDSRSKAMSWADWKRCAGCFSRQWRTMRSRAGGMAAGLNGFVLVAKSGGSSLRILALGLGRVVGL